MPHCIIEYSRSLEQQITVDDLVNTVHQAAVSSGLFEASHVRARAMAFDHCISGYNVDNFIHVTLRILSGRNGKQKSDLTSTVLGVLSNLGLESVSQTVEVVDMDRESYAKQVVMDSTI